MREKIVANACETGAASLIRVEFFGLARERAGIANWEVPACRLMELLHQIECAFPNFQGLLTSDGTASPFRISLNGERFVTTDEKLQPGEKVLILGAEAGG